MGLLQNIGYILIGFIALVSIFLIILTMLERKLHIKFLRGRYAKNQFYIEKLSKLDITKPNESLIEFNKLIKDFFREAFHIGGAPEYSELEKFFKKKNNKKASEICNSMTRFMYAGTKISSEDIQKIIYLSADVMSANKIISKDEKKELDKKSKQNQPNKIVASLKKIVKKK